MLTVNVLYLPNRKAYELQNSYTDGARKPASVTSAVTFNVKVQGHVTPLTGVDRVVDNLHTNFGLPIWTFRLIGQHLSDASRDLATLTFDLEGQGACR